MDQTKMDQTKIAIERLLATYSWFKGMVEDPNMDKELMGITIDSLIALWTKRLIQLQMEENLNRQEVKAGDDEQVSDHFVEQEVDWSRFED